MISSGRACTPCCFLAARLAESYLATACVFFSSVRCSEAARCNLRSMAISGAETIAVSIPELAIGTMATSDLEAEDSFHSRAGHSI
jgi:hypothetical protein